MFKTPQYRLQLFPESSVEYRVIRRNHASGVAGDAAYIASKYLETADRENLVMLLVDAQEVIAIQYKGVPQAAPQVSVKSEEMTVSNKNLISEISKEVKPNVNTIFKSRLKKTRMCRGITGRKMASLLDVSYTAYMNYENRGSQPPFDVLCKIADILLVSTDYLLGR